jgi:hypothetical protein
MLTMKTIIFIFTAAIMGLTSSAIAASVPGRQAVQMVQSYLKKDVLFGRTPDNRACVIDQVTPNRFHPDLQVRVYLGNEVDDVPSTAAWIRLDPRKSIEMLRAGSSVAFQGGELRVDEEGSTKIQSQMILSENVSSRKVVVTIRTLSAYKGFYESEPTPTRRADLTCVVAL